MPEGIPKLLGMAALWDMQAQVPKTAWQWGTLEGECMSSTSTPNSGGAGTPWGLPGDRAPSTPETASLGDGTPKLRVGRPGPGGGHLGSPSAPFPPVLTWGCCGSSRLRSGPSWLGRRPQRALRAAAAAAAGAAEVAQAAAGAARAPWPGSGRRYRLAAACQPSPPPLLPPPPRSRRAGGGRAGASRSPATPAWARTTSGAEKSGGGGRGAGVAPGAGPAARTLGARAAVAATAPAEEGPGLQPLSLPSAGRAAGAPSCRAQATRGWAGVPASTAPPAPAKASQTPPPSMSLVWLLGPPGSCSRDPIITM